MNLPSPNERPKILYITGWGRSGTTIVDNTLGEIDGFFSAGELSYLWSRGLLQNFRCGCGEPLRGCPVWKKVLASPFGRSTIGDLDPRQIVEWQREALRIRHTWRVLRAGDRPAARSPRLTAYASLLAAVYQAIQEVTGARVVIDSSKRPSGAALLGMLPDVDAYVVHMVRDPRAVAYSWQRKKLQPGFGDDRSMLVHSSWTSTAHWMVWNAAATAVRRDLPRSLLVRYEDFVAAPRQTIASIASFAGESPLELPFDDERTVRLGTNHTVSGNPSRFRTGPVEIRRDDEWIGAQHAKDRFAVTSLALASMHTYGYRIRTS